MRILTNTIKSNPFAKTAIKTADEILSIRRPFKNEDFTKADYLYLQERIANQALRFIQKDEKIPLVLVGFSMKSPSPLKTLSASADRAEYEALKHINILTEKINRIYDVGSEFKIYADGRIFTGRQAQKLGFVDTLGDMDTAKSTIEKIFLLILFSPTL